MQTKPKIYAEQRWIAKWVGSRGGLTLSPRGPDTDVQSFLSEYRKEAEQLLRWDGPSGFLSVAWAQPLKWGWAWGHVASSHTCSIPGFAR